jgi:osmotically-inducible protein OsmY
MSHAERNRTLCSGRRDFDTVDQSYAALVRAELLKSPYLPIRAVSCRLDDGVLTLKGKVPSYYFKQVAQRIAMDAIGGLAAVDNQLQVER